MGYYADVQHKILRDAGYEFEFVKLNNDNYTLGVISDIKRVRPELSYWEIWKCFRTAMAQLHAIDEVERVIRKNAGFECFPGMLEQLHKAFLLGLKDAHTPKEAHNVKTSYLKLIEKTPVNRPDRPLRVGVLGELYVVMEPYSNFFIEKELGSRGVEVTRFVTASCIVDETKADIRRLVKISNPYLKYDLGAHGTESVAMTLQLARRGYDGIIHVKPFGCMPEINAMPAMHHISRDTGIPVMYMSFDAQTSETGVKTRIEAFCDMISMRRQTCKGI
jgi:predicted nucleotide-binding protein (sugar kinase/HSP70/actin superfamily)